MKVSHLSGIEACPFLPTVEEPLRAAMMKQCGSDRGKDFYLLALHCAQSLWCQGLPAQSILLMNRAFGADLTGEEAILLDYPLPYSAMVWVMKYRREEDFIGNPRRHFQHLATRMVEPRKEIRSWRAWGCWWYSCQIFPDLSADDDQIRSEGIVEPTKSEIARTLDQVGVPGESQCWERAGEVL